MNINMILDGNYMLYRSVFLLHRLKTLYVDLETLMLNDYNNLTNDYHYDMIYFVSDSKKSWRKMINPEYKLGRKKDADIDWNFVFDTFDKVKDVIKNRHNCLLYQIDPFEGDDIIAHIVNESNKQGYSNFIVSNDGDIHQLLKFSVADNYINMMYNHKFSDEKIYVPKNYQVFMHHLESLEVDLFDLTDDNDFVNFFEKVKQKSKVVAVDGEESFFKKIVGGDGGDNILSVVKFTKEIRGIGDVGADSVWKMYKEKFPHEIDFDSNNFIERLCDILSIYRKNKEVDFRKKVAENIRKSRIMTRLDNKYLPDGLYQQLLENVKV